MFSANRKVLCSVFNAQEAREAVVGGARIIDSEDPKSALGNIKPLQIMAISEAVLDFRSNQDVQLSTNIGEDQLLFRRSEAGQAIAKSSYEMSGKSAQAAIGVACAMGKDVNPVNLVKVGVDGMNVHLVNEVLREIVWTLNQTTQYRCSQVMSVLFAQDLDTWDRRKVLPAVRRVLVEAREFNPSTRTDPGAFDLQDYAVGSLRDENGNVLFADRAQVSLGTLIQRGVLPEGSNSSFVCTTELFPHNRYFQDIVSPDTRKTTREVIKAMVDTTADAGAHAIMIDTSILSKTSRICCVSTSHEEMVDLNRFHVRDGIESVGILSLDDIRFFAEYCHFRGILSNLAGSITSYQAQQLWILVPALDQISTRGEASAVLRNPWNPQQALADTRQRRVIKRQLVRGLVPPEQGGVLNVPSAMKDSREAMESVEDLRAKLQERRLAMGLPPLESYFVDAEGTAEVIR